MQNSEGPYLLPKLFPKPDSKNLVIGVSGTGASKKFSVLMLDKVMDRGILPTVQCFPLYYYEAVKGGSSSLFDKSEQGYIRRNAIPEQLVLKVKKEIDSTLNGEDLFFFIYGVLHSREYRSAYANDLKKMIPRIPMAVSSDEFWAFSRAGRELADLHINYESVPPFPGIKILGVSSEYFRVEKMRFPKKDQKDTIIYNSSIRIENIPLRAYEYVVNGKSAIEWIMDRYQIRTHKASGIVNDPNDWAEEVGNPRYILDLLLSIINVSMKTLDIVESLPKITF